MNTVVYVKILGKESMWGFQGWDVAARWMAKVAQRTDATFLCFEEVPGGDGEIEDWPDAVIEAVDGKIHIISDNEFAA